MVKKLLKTIFIVLIVILFVKLLVNNSHHPVPLPEQYKNDRATYGQINQLFNDAMDLTMPPDTSGKPFDMPKEQENTIRNKLNEGISLSKNIDDNFFDYLNPEMKNMYREKYIRGYSLILEGINITDPNQTSLSVSKQLEGSNLIGDWNKWWDRNKDNITNKAFAE